MFRQGPGLAVYCQSSLSFCLLFCACPLSECLRFSLFHLWYRFIWLSLCIFQFSVFDFLERLKRCMRPIVVLIKIFFLYKLGGASLASCRPKNAVIRDDWVHFANWQPERHGPRCTDTKSSRKVHLATCVYGVCCWDNSPNCLLPFWI